MAQYIQVCDEEGEEPIEIPSEDDGSLLLSTLAAQFPGACGMKYRNPSTGNFRGIRLSEGMLHPPDGVWGNFTYIVVFPKDNIKRKGEEAAGENPLAKNKCVDKQRCSDLIVLGLPWKSNEDDLRRYFSTFGELLLVQVKRDPKTGASKGFGFIRFLEYDSQVKVLAQRHMIDGRWCDVAIPNSNEGAAEMVSRKVFVARCTEDITADDLKAYFCKYGEVSDVFIPKPFRAFAFVTFADHRIARSLCGEDHIIKGASVHVTTAAPKNSDRNDNRGRYDHGGGGRGGGHGGWTQQGKPIATVGTVPPVPDPNMANSIGMNLLNSAVLAAAQAMLQSQGQLPAPQPQPVGQGHGDPFGVQTTTARQSQQTGFFGNQNSAGWGTADTNSSAGGYPNWGGNSHQSGWS
ncbi:TAR DNA-binding protein 43-like isoform X1 [Crassostrea virginica]|uniref:TAR DNA-binding protein 43 n=1 Tax=Crassostrea virginica TaxID=6565 RepID=A0A8B8EX74_CRAVI|nr:TAR DNA-binding protein 43-like isoform X1 [Crassostrea virginica]